MFARIVEAIDCGKGLQPGLPALLSHDAIRAPGRQRVIESLVGRTHRLLTRKRHSCVVEALQITHAVVRRCGHDPGITPFTQCVGESAIVLKEESRLARQRSAHIVPVDRIGKIDVEVRDHWLAVLGHVSLGGEIRLLHVLQLANESLLRRTTRTGIPFDRPLIDHDREREAWMRFRFRHHQLRGLVDAVVRAVPVDNHAVYSTADHVGDLPLNLFRIGRTVADIHVVRASKPQHQMGIDLCSRARIEQAVNINFAHVAPSGIPVVLGRKTVCGTCIICGLRG